jgi:carbonic anhydrase/acetyltransferase-like protein (isoleucine patch superfamily)
MAIYRLRDRMPQIPASAWVAEEATVIGAVTLGEHASVWPGAVLRGDNEPILIGESSNVQEGAVLHTDPGFPITLAANVTIGHQAMLHGCTIGEGTLVGIQAVVLNNAVIGKYCLIGAGAIVLQGKTFGDRSLILGAPAKVIRELTDEEIAVVLGECDGYVQRQRTYRTDLIRIG